MTEERVLQIIPATGWYAIYKIDGKEERFPLAVWALIEMLDKDFDDKPFQLVRGMNNILGQASLVDVIEEAGEFLGYERDDG